MDPEETMQLTEEPASVFNRAKPSWIAVAGMLLAVIIPVCGWLVTLSNRVAVLEADSNRLSTAAVEIAQLRQELTDFRREYERDSSDLNQNMKRVVRSTTP